MIPTEDHDAYFEAATKKLIEKWERLDPTLIEPGCPCCGTPGEDLDPETGLCRECGGREAT